MPSTPQQTGSAGELLAQGYLEQMGMVFHDRNWYCRFGELDLVMQDGEEIVFVEVKMRKQGSLIAPEYSIDMGKVSRLKRAAEQYIEQHDKQEMFWRFDIVTISGDTHDCRIRHIADALRED